METTRTRLIEQLAGQISAVDRSHPIRVAIDGIDAAGKTTLANELKLPLAKLDRQVIRASIDGFHNPRKIRYQRGETSPEGYYFDSFDCGAIKEFLLKPLGPNGNLQYRTTVFDFHTDRPARLANYAASTNAILIIDGVFLQRPELDGFWDFTIFLDVEFDVAVARAIQRDQTLFGTTEAVKERYGQRYIPGQQIYFRICAPAARADVIIDNNDPMKPMIM